jgi:hypothetical protein
MRTGPAIFQTRRASDQNLFSAYTRLRAARVDRLGI